MTKLTKKQIEQNEINEAKAELHKLLKAGDTVYTDVGTVSRSGMSRTMSVYIPVINEHTGKPDIRDITHLVAKVAGYKRNDRGELKVGGCGMDMGFAVVYSLAARMFGRGGECKAYGYVRGRNGDTEPETDGGYMLHQRWL